MTAKDVYARDRALLDSSVRKDISSWAGLASDQKSIRELFPRSSNSSFRPLLSGCKADVWNTCWSDPLLWIQAHRAKWGAAVQSISLDQAKGVAVIPVDKTKSWFWALGEVAVDWWGLPHHLPIISDDEGRRYPQQKGLATRVVFFDTFGNEQGDDKPTEARDDVEPGEWLGGGGGTSHG